MHTTLQTFKKFKQNDQGTDWVVGDINGEFSLLLKGLKAIRFNPAVDRLFATGNLTGKSPFPGRISPNLYALQWLVKPWFHTVAGEMEQRVRLALTDMEVFSSAHEAVQERGFDELVMLDEAAQIQWQTAYRQLPWLIQVTTPRGEALVSPNQLSFKGDVISQPWIEQHLYFKRNSLLMSWLAQATWDKHAEHARSGLFYRVYCGRVLSPQPQHGLHVAMNGLFGEQPCIRLSSLTESTIHCLHY